MCMHRFQYIPSSPERPLCSREEYQATHCPLIPQADLQGPSIGPAYLLGASTPSTVKGTTCPGGGQVPHSATHQPSRVHLTNALFLQLFFFLNGWCHLKGWRSPPHYQNRRREIMAYRAKQRVLVQGSDGQTSDECPCSLLILDLSSNGAQCWS